MNYIGGIIPIKYLPPSLPNSSVIIDPNIIRIYPPYGDCVNLLQIMHNEGIYNPTLYITVTYADDIAYNLGFNKSLRTSMITDIWTSAESIVDIQNIFAYYVIMFACESN